MGSHLPFTCRDVEVCAAALLDAQLSPAEEEMVEEHLEHCDACAEMIDAMDAQRLKLSRLQIMLQENDYWEEMDAVLQAGWTKPNWSNRRFPNDLYDSLCGDFVVNSAVGMASSSKSGPI